jgi:hypothetical protein
LSSAKLLEVKTSRIDPLREALLRGALQTRRNFLRGTGADPCESRERRAVLEFADGRLALGLLCIAQRGGDQELGRRCIECRDGIRRRRRVWWRFAQKTR